MIRNNGLLSTTYRRVAFGGSILVLCCLFLLIVQWNTGFDISTKSRSNVEFIIRESSRIWKESSAGDAHQFLVSMEDQIEDEPRNVVSYWLARAQVEVSLGSVEFNTSINSAIELAEDTQYDRQTYAAILDAARTFLSAGDRYTPAYILRMLSEKKSLPAADEEILDGLLYIQGNYDELEKRIIIRRKNDLGITPRMIAMEVKVKRYVAHMDDNVIDFFRDLEESTYNIEAASQSLISWEEFVLAAFYRDLKKFGLFRTVIDEEGPRQREVYKKIGEFIRFTQLYEDFMDHKPFSSIEDRTEFEQSLTGNHAWIEGYPSQFMEMSLILIGSEKSVTDSLLREWSNSVLENEAGLYYLSGNLSIARSICEERLSRAEVEEDLGKCCYIISHALLTVEGLNSASEFAEAKATLWRNTNWEGPIKVLLRRSLLTDKSK